MERMENGDFDLLRVRMEKRFRRAEIEIGTDGNREQISGMDFSVSLSPNLARAGEEAAAEVFWSRKRPPVFFLTQERTAGLTFQPLHEELDAGALIPSRERVRRITEQIDERTVLYDSGEGGRAAWFDYKSFAGKEAVYNMTFLFQVGQRKILGTFFCAFGAYDKWKPAVLGMMDSIKTQEEEG